MESARQFALIVCVVVSSSQAACIASTELDGLDGEDEVVAEVQQEVVVHNALTRNALTRNALTRNALTRNALTRNALTRNALMSNSLASKALRDPEARELLRLHRELRSPRGRERRSRRRPPSSYTFVGELGLAPEWGKRNGSCGETCQKWVSACLLSRVNYRGEHVTILAPREGRRALVHEEGARRVRRAGGDLLRQRVPGHPAPLRVPRARGEVNPARLRALARRLRGRCCG